MTAYLRELEAARDADAEHELRIRAKYDEYDKANKSGQGARSGELWKELVELIAQRSPRQVLKMECEKGLR